MWTYFFYFITPLINGTKASGFLRGVWKEMTKKKWHQGSENSKNHKKWHKVEKFVKMYHDLEQNGSGHNLG